MAAAVWLFHHLGAADADIGVLAVGMTLALALAMISSIPWRSFKDVDLKGRISFPAAFAFAIVLAIIFWEPPIVLFVITTAYAVSGPLVWVWRRAAGKPAAIDSTAEDESATKNDESPAKDKDEKSSESRPANLH